MQKLKKPIQTVELRIANLTEDTETDIMKELEKALFDNGYSEKVKEAIIKLYFRD